MMNKIFKSQSTHSSKCPALKESAKQINEYSETSLTTMDTIDCSPKDSSLIYQQISTFSLNSNSIESMQINSLKNVASYNFSKTCESFQDSSIQDSISQQVLNHSNNRQTSKKEIQTSFHQAINQQYEQNASKLIQKQKNFQLISIQDMNDDQESDDEEEFSIWGDSEFRSLGINTNSFMDSRGEELTFYQLYRLRSVLYQPSYISRLDTIKEVQIISSHYDQEIPINDLKNQQVYLDNFYQIQTKDFPRVNEMKKVEKYLNPLTQLQKCSTERTQRAVSNYEQKEAYLFQNQVKMNDSLYNFKNLNYSQQQKKLNQKNQESLPINSQKSSEVNSDFSQLQILNQKYKSQRRQKISIDQESAQKLIQGKLIPIKQITLFEKNLCQDNSQPSIDTQQAQSQTINLSESNSEAQNSNSLKIQEASIIKSNQKQNSQLNIAQTAQSVLSYLKGVIYSKKSQDEKQISIDNLPNSKQNLADQSHSPRFNLDSAQNQKGNMSLKQNKKQQSEIGFSLNKSHLQHAK